MDIIAEAGIKDWEQLFESAQKCAQYIDISDPTMDSILRNVGGIPDFDLDTMSFEPPDDGRQYSVYDVPYRSSPSCISESPAFPKVPTRQRILVYKHEFEKQKQLEDLIRDIADYILRKFPDIKNYKSLLRDLSEDARIRQLRSDVEQGRAEYKRLFIGADFDGDFPSVGEVMLSVNDKAGGLYVHQMRITGRNYLANMWDAIHKPLHAYSAILQDKLSNSYPESLIDEAPLSLKVQFNEQYRTVEEVIFVNGLTSQVIKNTYPASVTNNKRYIQSRVDKIASKIEKAIGPEAAIQMYEDGEDTPDVWMYFLAWLLTSDQTLPQKLLSPMVEQTPVMQVEDLTELAHEEERYVYSDEFAETLIDRILEVAGFDDLTESEQEDLGEMIYERVLEKLISNAADDIERVKYSSWLEQAWLPSDKINEREQGEDVVNAILDLVAKFEPPVVEIDFGRAAGVDVGWAYQVNPYFIRILHRPDLLASEYTKQDEEGDRKVYRREIPLKS